METDEKQIRSMIAAWSKALESKDIDGLTENYLSETVLFDAIPPYKYEGVTAIRTMWEMCLTCFPERFKSEHRDIAVHVAGDTAFAHFMHHIWAEQEDHPCAQTWLRVSVGYKRVNEKWKVAHEHVSLPFNPMNEKVWYIKDLETIDQPDYSQAVGS